MKVCIIGSSGHINYVIDGIKKDKEINITAIAAGSANEDMGKIFEQLKEIGCTPSQYKDPEEMLKLEKPDIVVVATIFGDLAKWTVKALDYKCHVMVEKPISTSYEGLLQIKDSQKKAGTYLAAMLGSRYANHFYTAWKLTQAGKIGEIRLINVQKSYKLGARPEFYQDRIKYGGTIPWVGSHAIDLIRWFSGEQYVTVYASHTTRANHGLGDLETTALCHFTLTNEVMGSVNIDYLRPYNSPRHDDDRIYIAGTKGVIEVINQQVLLINDEFKGIQQVKIEDGGNIMLDFINQIKGKGNCLVSEKDSFAMAEACLKARQSADEKCIISFVEP